MKLILEIEDSAIQGTASMFPTRALLKRSAWKGKYTVLFFTGSEWMELINFCPGPNIVPYVKTTFIISIEILDIIVFH